MLSCALVLRAPVVLTPEKLAILSRGPHASLLQPILGVIDEAQLILEW